MPKIIVIGHLLYYRKCSHMFFGDTVYYVFVSMPDYKVLLNYLEIARV